MGAEHLIEHRTRPDFVPVVVLGINPEDRDDRHAVLARYLVGQLERGQRFEERKERAPEKSRLLSGHERNRSRVGQQPGGFTRARRSVATLLLVCHHRRNPAVIARVRLRAADGVRPRGTIAGIAAEKRCEG